MVAVGHGGGLPVCPLEVLAAGRLAGAGAELVVVQPDPHLVRRGA